MKTHLLDRAISQVVGRFTSFLILLMVFGFSANSQDDISSPSDNVPPKKEKLVAKIKRYESAGYKIAVYQQVDVLAQQKQLSSTTAIAEKQVPISGTGSLCDACIENRSAEVASMLNEKYSTSVFEAVDESRMPQKTVLGIGIPDWWKTKYKAVVLLKIFVKGDAFIDSKEDKIRFDLFATHQNMMVEYINEKNGKQKLIANSTTNFLSEKLLSEENHTLQSAIALKLKMDAIADVFAFPSDDVISEAYSSSFEDSMKDFMAKLNKK